MTRAFVATGFAVVLALSGCSKPTPPGPKKSGPAVAQGEGVIVTAAEFQARLDEQSPFLRQRYQNLDRKKEFLDSLVKFEILANAAQKEGFQNDPDVQLTMKKAMVQKLVQKRFGDGDAKDISDADVQKFYDEHKDDFVKPVRVRTSALLVAATEKDRAQKGAQAKKLLAQVKASSKKDPQAFQALVRSTSDDAASKGNGGDLGFRSEDEYAKQFGAPFAAAAFATTDGEEVLVETQQGFWIVRVAGRQEGVTRTVDQVKPQIQSRLQREKRTKEFDDYVKKLREEAKVTVNDAELEKIVVSSAPAPGPGGMPPGGMPPGAMPPPGAQPRPAMPMPPPAPAPTQK
jgi:peptidyl-prolyl cis-trans isomerase C